MTAKTSVNPWFIGLLGCAILCCNLCFAFTSPALDYFDEGSSLYASRQIAMGEVLYRDQLYYKMPLSYYLLGFVFWIFGSSMAVSRIAGAISGAVIVLLFFACARRLVSRRTALFTTLVYYLFTMPQRNIYHNGWIALLGMLCCLLIALAFNRRPSSYRALALGFAIGLTLVTKQTYGFFIFLAFFFWLPLRLVLATAPKDRFRQGVKWAGAVILGMLLVISAVLLYFLFHSAATSFVYYTVFYPLTAPGFTEGIELPFPYALDLVELMAFIIPPVIYALTLILLIKSSHTMAGRQKLDLLLVALIGMSTYFTVFPRPDFRHLLYALFPAFLCAAVLLQRWQRTLAPRDRSRASATLHFINVVMVMLLFSLPVIGGAVKTISIYALPMRPLRLREAWGISTSDDDAASCERTVLQIKRLSSAHSPIYVGPWAPLLYILSERQNATRIRLLAYGHFSQEPYQREIVASLEKKKAPLVVWTDHPTVQAQRGPNPESFALLVRQYLDHCYQPVQRFGTFQLMIRSCD